MAEFLGSDGVGHPAVDGVSPFQYQAREGGYHHEGDWEEETGNVPYTLRRKASHLVDVLHQSGIGKKRGFRARESYRGSGGFGSGGVVEVDDDEEDDGFTPTPSPSFYAHPHSYPYASSSAYRYPHSPRQFEDERMDVDQPGPSTRVPDIRVQPASPPRGALRSLKGKERAVEGVGYGGEWEGRVNGSTEKHVSCKFFFPFFLVKCPFVFSRSSLRFLFRLSFPSEIR
jgi:hypothetical protein